MGIFQFNIRDEHGIVVDEEGMELPDILSVVREALQSVREFSAEAPVPDGMMFEITDEAGRLVLALPIRRDVSQGEEQGFALAS
jgi:hypothetical protein